MPILDLLTQSYPAKSEDQNQAQLTNMYLEADQAKGKYKVVAYPMPGLTVFSTLPQTNIRAMYEWNNVLYVVAGNGCYVIASNGNYLLLFNLNTSSGFAKIKAIAGGGNNNGQLFIIDSVNGYAYNTTTNVLTIMTNTQFVNTVTIVNVGSNYSASPTVTISDPTGSGASVSANVVGGQISSFVVNAGGHDYTNPTLVITDPTGSGASGIVNLATNSFPNNAIDLENQDDILVALPNNSIEWQISNVSDSRTWDPLNFASKIGQPDNIVGILSHESMLWLFGDKTSEVWYNAGNAAFPFQRVSTTFLHYGLAATQSIAVNGNYFIFVSTNRGGGYSVFQTLPRIYYYNPAPISTPPIDTLLNFIGTNVGISDAIGDIANFDGHEFYTLTLPAGNTTLVYDVPKTQQADAQKGAWYYRKSYNTGTGQYGRFLSNCSVFCYNKQMIGDYNSGHVYYLNDQVYTENGTPILREFVSPPGPTYFEGKRVYFDRLQIDVETGVGTNEDFDLYKSLDNGNTWIHVGTYTIPPKGGRIYVTRLGQTRYGMIFKITTTMNANFCLLGFQAEVRVGVS